MGAFKFFGRQGGYPYLGTLAEMIDTISRTYAEDSGKELHKDHYQLLVDAARCSYLILKDMRDGRSIPPDRIQTHAALAKRFTANKDLKFKENKTQTEVDEIIDQLKQSS